MTTTRKTAPSIAELHGHFLATSPTIERHADAVYENSDNFHDPEDAVAETVVLAWTSYYRVAGQGPHELTSPTMPARSASMLLG